jgi:lysophospholipase L1-like esterase
MRSAGAIHQIAVTTLCAAALAACAHGPEPTEAANAVWTNALDLGLEGQGWTANAHPYDRLPARAKRIVRRPVWQLAHDSAGMCVRFVSDSPQIFARWTVRMPRFTMDHMADTGISGIDLYARDDSAWRWVGTGRVRQMPTNESKLVEHAPPGPHEYMLYLPLYNGIDSLEIGVSPEFSMSRAPRYPQSRRPIVFYGTSITQGGCASRPGMAYPAILGRRLGCPTINLGFSGNGRMDLELAGLLAEIDASVYVLDCGANMTEEMLRKRTVPFIRKLHRARPETPIVLIDDAVYQDMWFNAVRRAEYETKIAVTREAFETLQAEGVGNLYHVESLHLIGDDGEGTVDGVHLTDLGFIRMADALEPLLRSLAGD